MNKHKPAFLFHIRQSRWFYFMGGILVGITIGIAIIGLTS